MNGIKTMLAFLKKEWMEQIRSNRLLILGIVFLGFGIMNPAIAKITPWLMEMMADSLEETGMIVTEVEVDALTSWTQFFKNIPMGLIVFVLMQSNVFTKEYQSGTLVMALTKGLERYKVVAAKTIILLLIWTGCYWLCYGTTYGYNAFYWDNAIAKHIGFGAFCWWLMGIFVVMLVVCFSVIGKNNSTVLLGTGGVAFGFYMVGMIPKLTEYVPTKLMDGISLLTGIAEPGDYVKAVLIAIVLSGVSFLISIPMFNKKNI